MSDRAPDYPIDPLFVARWSPRAFDASTMPEDDLLRAMEAARWAPSAFNVQPWRFLYALRGDPCFDEWLDLLDDYNRSWARQASALVFLLSDTLLRYRGDTSPSRTHSFDAGAAWAQLALETTRLGYHAHGMAGFDSSRARALLDVPEDFHIELAIAIGRRAAPSTLPEALREREHPSPRRRTVESAFRGGFHR